MLMMGDVSPPLAACGSSPARKCRPPSSARSAMRPSSSSSFASASGRERSLDQRRPRPMTSRPASSHRKLMAMTPTTTQWQFLTKTSTEREPTQSHSHSDTIADGRSPFFQPPPPRVRSRPTTARVISAPPPSSLPKRPATCRGLKHRQSSFSGSSTGLAARPPPVTPAPLSLVDARVVHEAAHRETEHEHYTSPLMGKSVDVAQPEFLSPQAAATRDSCVVNAVSVSEIHRIRAFQARARGDHQNAISHYEKRLQVSSNDAIVLFQLAVAYEKTGQLDKANAAYQRLLLLDGDNPFVHYNCGNLQMQRNQIQQAIASYSAAIQLSGGGRCPQMAFYRQRGAAYRKHGDFEKAAQDYARVHVVVQKRRASVPTLATSATTAAAAGGGEGRQESTGTQPPDDLLVSDTYSAEPIYSPSRFTMTPSFSSDPSRVANPEQPSSIPLVDELRHRRAMEIASKRRKGRSEDNLWVLSDALAHQFPWCGSLAPEAKLELSRRVIAGTCLPRGTPLLVEDEDDKELTKMDSGGRFVFFLARGRVAIYKKFTPHLTATKTTEVKKEGEANSETKTPETVARGRDEPSVGVVSWEQAMRAAQSGSRCDRGRDSDEDKGKEDDDDSNLHPENDDDDVDYDDDVSATVVDALLRQQSARGGSSAIGWEGSSPSSGRGTPPTNERAHHVLVTHLMMGAICGRQGRFSQQPQRSYSAVATEACDVFAVSWADLKHVEQLHRIASSTQLTRFLCTLPVFHGIPPDQLRCLSQTAKSHKLIGERVVCSEGQHVNGLVVVREGALCQLYPSQLERPPNLQVAFHLSGALSIHGTNTNGHDADVRGRHLFTQLEFRDDSLLFLHDSGAMHGFVSPQYVPTMLAKLSKLVATKNRVAPTTTPSNNMAPTTTSNNMAPTTTNASTTTTTTAVAPPLVGATRLTRGGFFCAASSWIPPRLPNPVTGGGTAESGVTCAKTGLVSTKSSELLFFTSSDLIQSLSLASRTILQRNIHQINDSRRATSLAAAPVTTTTPRPQPPTAAAAASGSSNLSRLVFLKPPSGDDLLQQFAHESDWQVYKRDLVQSIVQDASSRHKKKEQPHHRHDWK